MMMEEDWLELLEQKFRYYWHLEMALWEKRSVVELEERPQEAEPFLSTNILEAYGEEGIGMDCYYSYFDFVVVVVAAAAAVVVVVVGGEDGPHVKQKLDRLDKFDDDLTKNEDNESEEYDRMVISSHLSSPLGKQYM